MTITLRFLVINISSFSPALTTAAYYQRCVITCETVPVVHRRPRLQHLAYCSVNTGSQARYRLRIAISAYPTCIRPPVGGGGSRRNIAMPFRREKLEWRGYPMQVKQFWWYVYSFWRNSPRTWQTDRQTDTAWRHRPRLHSIARQKLWTDTSLRASGSLNFCAKIVNNILVTLIEVIKNGVTLEFIETACF